MAESLGLNFDTRNSTSRKASKSGQLIVEGTQLDERSDEREPVKLVRDTLIKEYHFFVNNANLTEKIPKNERSLPKSTEDIINSELANMEDPITETIVIMPRCNSCDFYVDVPKNISYSDEKVRMFRKMKERLNKEEHCEYFDEAGSPIFHLTSLCPKTKAQYLVRKDLLDIAYVPPFVKKLSDALMETHKLRDDISLIDIQFNTFKFKHHYLYTLEDVLTQCLQETYAEYDNRNAMNILKNLEDHLKVNRNARDKVLKELTKLQKSKNQIYIDSTLLKYDKVITELKESYYLERKKDEEIVTKIILLWDDIKKVRKESSIVNSSVIVEIFKVNISEEEINKAWDEMYDSEFMDELYHIEHLFAKELSEYTKRKHNNKNSENEKLTKPRLNIDEDEIKQRIEERLNVLIPKGPKVMLELKFDTNLITRKVSDPREIERSRKISNTTYNFRVFVDESIVCDTDQFRLNNNFCANLSDAFSIQIVPTNKCIKVSMLENEAVIANIKIDIKGIKKYSLRQEVFNTKAKIEMDDYTVGSGNNLQDICKKLKIVLKSTNILRNKFYTKGEISMMLGWSDHNDGNKMSDNKGYSDITKKIKNCLSFSAKLDFDMLSDIITNIAETKEELHSYMAIHDQFKDALHDKWFPDSNVIHEVDKTTDNARYKLLNFRESEKFINLKNSIIPLHSSQISTEQMQCLRNKTGIPHQYYIPEEYHTMDMEPLDLQRYFGAKYIQIINTHIQQNLHDSMLEKSYEDVVQDNQPTNSRMIISKINIRNSRTSKLSNTIYRHSSSSHLLHITILRAFSLPDRMNVGEVNTSPSRNDDEDFIIKQLRPIVRVTHKDNVEQTSTAIGCNPSWNQTLHLSIRSFTTSVVNINIYDEVKEDLMETYDSDEPQQNKVHYRISHKWLGYLQIPLASIHSVSKLQGAVKINVPPVILGYQNSTDSNLHHTLNDQILLMHKDAAFITLSATIEPHPQTHLNRINSCLQNSEGFIFRHLNDFLLNYSKEFPSRTLSLTYFTTAGHQKCVILFLQALPLPDLDLLQKDLRTYLRRESAMSKSSSSSAVRSVEGRRNSPDERVDSVNTPHSNELRIGERDSTQNTLESRSLRKEGNQLDNVINVCARYVSLIPTYEATQTYQVTLMGWELLKILNGSPVDHTILLASYLLYLGVKCWIICGMGLPRGFSSYVLIKYDILAKRILLTTDKESRSKHFYTTKQDSLVPYIYDAVSGTKYGLRDASCPLKTVHYVYNDENIWINIQLMESCDSVHLDLTRTSDWQPVFNKDINLSKLPTISEHNLYAVPENVDSLRERIENKIKAKVQKWRSHRRTIWNRYCSSVLKESLSSWEYWTFNPTTPKPAPSNRLKQLMSTYKIYGFPLNLPYTNMKRILSSIKSTTLFLNEEPFVEFGLAVEIYSYPGAVCSVWIYLASITRT